MTDIHWDDKPPLDELAHHGVKGMHWGVRKDDSSGGTASGGSSIEKLKDPKLSDNQKKAIVAATIAVGAIAAAAVLRQHGLSVPVPAITSENVVSKATERVNASMKRDAARTIATATKRASLSPKKVESARNTAEFLGKRRDEISRSISDASRSGVMDSHFTKELLRQHGELSTKLLDAPYANRGQARTLKKMGF